MKNNILKHFGLAACMVIGASMTSCEDFLTIKPTSQIVEEEFWEDKSDLNNAVYGCYKRLASSDILSRYIYWGEMRSDNIEREGTTSTSDQYANIMNAYILPSYDCYNWNSMYNAINCCNKVLVHGPEVVEKDESFSEADWLPIKAEITTLRALSHFWLVRTFGEIPYVDKDYSSSEDELRIEQSTQLTVLNNIINDLESVKGYAVSEYGNSVLNHGRITKKAILTLLADVYLWRASYKAGNNQPFKKITITKGYEGTVQEGQVRTENYSPAEAQADYQKCIDYCDEVISIVRSEKIQSMKKNNTYSESEVQRLGLADYLVQYVNMKALNPRESTANMYNVVFGTGNSDESIFEIQFDGTNNSNSMLTSLFWNIKDGKAGHLSGSTELFTNVKTDVNVLEGNEVFPKTDYRRWSSLYYTTKAGGTVQNEYNIAKYVRQTCKQTSSSNQTYLVDNSLPSSYSAEYTLYTKDNVSANWIVYRLSEVYLMKAEALNQLEGNTEDNNKEAFTYVAEVFKRSNPYAYFQKLDTLDFLKYESKESMERLILDERQREFIAEGKRWFDLVRYAQRHAKDGVTPKEMLDIVTRKYVDTKDAVKTKLADMQRLFAPVNENELKYNNLLYQNGVWESKSSSSMTDNL